MRYKKFFSAAALVTVLSLSNSAFSDSSPIGMTEGDDTSYYVRFQYNGEFLPFKTKIEGMKNEKAGNPAESFDPFKASFIGGSGAFGYKMDDYRVEFEGLYSQLDKNVVTDATFTPTAVADNLTVMSVLFNAYYDLSVSDEVPINIYVGGGAGPAYINNPSAVEAVKDQKGFGVAGQAKVGVSYAFTPEIKGYAGARYFGSYGAKFGKTTLTDNKIKVLYSVIGAETGVMFNF